EEYSGRGATIAAIVIDTPAQNAAMVEKLALPFPILSDPDGAAAIKPLDAWNTDGKMAKPAIIVVTPDGTEAYRYVGVDFADRPGDDEVLAAIQGLDLPPIDVSDGVADHPRPEPSGRAMSLPDLGVYMRGVRFAMMALAGRARDEYDRSEAERTAKMAERFIAAQGATLRLTKKAVDAQP
ncbi:MAG: peroxiredoxin family protein, partial [Thermomicrobiales bacterium]